MEDKTRTVGFYTKANESSLNVKNYNIFYLKNGVFYDMEGNIVKKLPHLSLRKRFIKRIKKLFSRLSLDKRN